MTLYIRLKACQLWRLLDEYVQDPDLIVILIVPLDVLVERMTAHAAELMIYTNDTVVSVERLEFLLTDFQPIR